MARPPSEQWWAINGADMMAALERAHGGDEPWIVYTELIANSEAAS